MQVTKAPNPDKVPKKHKLKDVKPGDVFRFATTSAEEAFNKTDEKTFYMVVEVQPKKTGRVTIVSTDGKSLLEKDDDHLVIIHDAILQVGECQYETAS